MYIHFKSIGRLIIALWLIIRLTSAVCAQSQVVVNLTTTLMNPPYNVPFEQLKDKTRVTLISNTDLENVFLALTIRGDNGITIQSNGNQIDPFFLPAGTPVVIPGIDNNLDLIFQEQNLSSTGIDVQSLYDFGLPPGNYQICFRLWQSSSSGILPVSPAAPSGCTEFSLQQGSITVNTSVIPPFDADFLQYFDKVHIMLMSSQLNNIYLHLTLKGNNGIEIHTSPDYVPPDLIQLQPNIPLTLSGMDLWAYFNPDNLVFSGILRQDIEFNGLPEGTYRICVQAYNQQGEPISGNDPLGCSNSFSIQLLQPPVIISPQCGKNIKADGSPLIFSWTLSPGAPPGTPYTLRIVEMTDPDVPPGDALLTATTPDFFETTVMGNSFLYGPAQPVLEKGKKYAFEVIAGTEVLNINNSLDFDASKLHFKNKGRSEPCYFNYGEMPNVSGNAPTNLVTGGPEVNPITPKANILPYSQVKGKLRYKFKDFRYSLNNLNFTSSDAGSGQGSSGNYQVTTETNTGNLSVNTSGISSQNNQIVTYINDKVDPTGSQPLAGVRVSLVVKYVYKNTEVKGKVVNNKLVSRADYYNTGKGSEYQQHFGDNDKVLKTTYTDSRGNFSFSFVNSDNKIGQLQDLNITHSGEMGDEAHGKVYKTIRLIVDNQYYCSPDQDIIIKPLESMDLGTLVSYVKSYNLEVDVHSTSSQFYEQSSGQDAPLNNVKTVIRRGSVVNHVPFNEGQIKEHLLRVPGNKYQVAEGTTDGDGKVIFSNLVMHDPDNNQDRYYISCATSKTSGSLNYKDKERRYNPIMNADKKKFPYNRQVKEEMASGNEGGIDLGPQYETYGSNITFNSELKIRTYQFKMEMYPKLPRVYGQAFATGMKDYVHINNVMKDTIMPGVRVLLFSKYSKLEKVPKSENTKTTLSIKSTYTNQSGRYSFNNLPIENDINFITDPNGKKSLEANITGPKRWIIAKPKGFGAIEADLGTLKYGDQAEKNLNFLADGILAGIVEDNEGNAVPADVKIEGYPAVSTGKPNFITALAVLKAKIHGFNQIPKNAEMFVFLAPSGNKRKITVIPHDLSTYLPYDTTITIPKFEGNQTKVLQWFTVRKLMHRVKFRVMAFGSPNPPAREMAKPVSGVTLKITSVLGDIAVTTDNGGYATLQFVHSDSSFHMDIIPPESSEYTNVKDLQFHSIPSGKVVFKKTYYLYPGYKLSGKVTIGSQNEPADSVKVYVDQNEDIYTYSDEKGQFEIHKIPGRLKAVTVMADKYDPDQTIIGDKMENINLPYRKQIDLHLTIEKKVPNSLFGFPVLVDSVDDQGNTLFISGSLKDIDQLGNNNFQINLNKISSLKFNDVKLVKKEGSDEFGPDAASIPLNKDAIPLIVNGAFLAEQMPVSSSLVQIEPENNGAGVIRGRVKISGSFAFNANLFSFAGEEPWLVEAGKAGHVIPVLRPAPDKTAVSKYLISDKSGNALKVKLKGFNGVADKDGSYLSGDTLVLPLVLTTGNIQGMTPSSIKIDIGEARITPDKVMDMEGTNNLSFGLEKWKVDSKNWSLTQQSKGIEIESGTLKTGVLDLPVKNIVITPGSIEINQIELNSMSLAGVAPLNIVSKDLSFGYFPSIGADQKGHWRLAIVGLNGSPAATISGLPGMAAGKNISFKVVSVLSNGEQSLDLMSQQEDLVFYDILKVKPLGIYPYDGYFQLTGSMDMGIPRVEKQNGKIRFSKSGSQVEFTLYPLKMNVEVPGKVKFTASQKFGDQVFDNSTFSAPGVINDAEGITLNARLHRTKQQIWVEVDPYDQKLHIGNNNSTYMSDIHGETRVDNSKNDWDYFTFNGIMNGVNGMEGDKKKTFTIYGDINADNQSVKVKNIDTGFGSINITYDFPHSRMIGNMEINKSFSGLTLHGMANLLVDGSGWYFLAGGQIETPGIGGFQAGIMIGDYNVMPPDVTDKIMQFAYDKTIPSGFSNHISGMFITGRKSIPVIDIPDVSIDLWILSARLGIDAGLDARLWMAFNDAGNEFGIGAMAFAHAYFIASSITCTSLSADARAELGAKGSYNTGTGTFSIGGCGSFSLGARIEQCFPTLVAGCEGCIGKSLSESIKVNMLFDSKGNTDLSFGFGNCSGQSSLSAQ